MQSRTSGPDDVRWACAGESDELGRCEADQVRRRAGSRPDQRVPEQRALDEHLLYLWKRKRRHCPRCEARRVLDFLRRRHAGRLGPGGPGDLLEIAAPVAGDERHDRPALGHEDEGLHDLIEVAAHCRGCLGSGEGVLGERLDAGLGAGLAKKGGNPLDGLRPDRYHGRKCSERRQTRRACVRHGVCASPESRARTDMSVLTARELAAIPVWSDGR